MMCSNLPVEACPHYLCCSLTEGVCGGGECSTTTTTTTTAAPDTPSPPPGDGSTGDDDDDDDNMTLYIIAGVAGAVLVGLIIWVSMSASKNKKRSYRRVNSSDYGSTEFSPADYERGYYGASGLDTSVYDPSDFGSLRGESARRVGELTY